MMAGGGRIGRRRSGLASLLTIPVWVLSALLVLHAALLLPDQGLSRQLDRVLNPGGMLGAERQFDQPSVQPRSPVPVLVVEARTLLALHTLAPDQDSSWALAGGATVLLSSPADASLRPAGRDRHPSVQPRAFDARAPPSRS